MVEKLQRNINIVYALAFFHMFLLIVPVLVPYFQSKGLSLSEIFYLQAIYAGAIVILEAPSGYFADVMGRRLALLYDSERALAQGEGEHAQSLSQLGFTKSLAEGLGALFGGLLAMWSFDIMILVQSLTAWVCLWMALLVVEPPVDNASEPGDRVVSLRDIYQHVARGDRILRMVFIALPVYNLATIHVAWLIQPYWDDMGLSLALFGALWFAQSLTVALASKCSYALERTTGAVFALVVIGILPVIGIFGMAWLGGWAGVALCFMLFFCRGLYQVILANALNRRIPGRCRATVNSLNSLLFRFGFIVTGPFVGYLADMHGISAALNLLGVWSVLAFAVIMLPLIRAVRLLEAGRIDAQRGRGTM
ncbi:MAG: hypothetical protein CMQ34_15375 [Gammaproteobacteria bacterium]|nr:hypothetical protein [Gammaproteobacteria bacterium]MBC55208.1 hypothetical protein [Gammaproteobacteria bacterium]